MWLCTNPTAISIANSSAAGAVGEGHTFGNPEYYAPSNDYAAIDTPTANGNAIYGTTANDATPEYTVASSSYIANSHQYEVAQPERKELP